MHHHLLHPFNRQQLRRGFGMARLAAALATTALEPFRRLKTSAGRKRGGAGRAPADPLQKAGQLTGQSDELAAELVALHLESLNVLLLSKDQWSDAGWCCQPIRLWNPARNGDRHRRGLCLRCHRESGCRQGCSRDEVRDEPSRPLNGDGATWVEPAVNGWGGLTHDPFWAMVKQTLQHHG